MEVRAIVEDRAATVVDSDIGNFIVEATPNVLRGIRIGQLADFLGKFGPEYKAYFESRLLSDGIAKQYYDNLITHRHSTAHSTGPVVTLNDVKVFYARGHLILDYFQETLAPIIPGDRDLLTRVLGILSCVALVWSLTLRGSMTGFS